MKTEDSEGAIITLHSTNASELGTDEVVHIEMVTK